LRKRFLAAIACLFTILAGATLYRYQQYILAWSANSGIEAGGVRLMMPASEVRALLGDEEEYIPGFGGYVFGYETRGTELTLLSDGGTDFYNKVSEIKVTGPAHAIYGVRVGYSGEDALKTLHDRGFTHERPGWSGLWKMNLFVRLDVDGSGKVSAITIGIKDRVAQSRVY
jgi:hypothetical protein